MRALIPAFVLVVGLLSSCSRKEKQDAADDTKEVARHGLTAEQAAQVLAEVGTSKITLGMFADQLANMSPYIRDRYSSPERRKEYLDNMIRFELLVQEAKKRGYFDSEEIKRSAQQVMIREMMKKDFEEKYREQEISEDEIKSFYQSNIDEFRKPAQARLSHIRLSNRALGARLLKQLKNKPGDDEFFVKLVQKHSEDTETKSRGGDVGFQTHPKDRKASGSPEVPDAVIEAAFTLEKVGDVHDKLISSDHGFHIVRLTAKREALERSLDDARRTIQMRLRREKRDAAIEKLVTELRKKAEIKEDWSVLDEVKIGAQ